MPILSRSLIKNKNARSVQNESDGKLDYAIARKQMIKEQLMGRDIRDPHVLAAMQRVPRHMFLDSAQYLQAYEDRPLPLGHGATISQPYIVAYMLQALQLKPEFRVLEVGTGCGYQTALLAELCFQVYSIEVVRELFSKARTHLKQLRYKNIILKLGDGSLGWPEFAPFDAIVVAAAAPQIPPKLIEQLADSGKMVLPIETIAQPSLQELLLVSKIQGEVKTEKLLDCRFVKMR